MVAVELAILQKAGVDCFRVNRICRSPACFGQNRCQEFLQDAVRHVHPKADLPGQAERIVGFDQFLNDRGDLRKRAAAAFDVRDDVANRRCRQRHVILQRCPFGSGQFAGGFECRHYCFKSRNRGICQDDDDVISKTATGHSISPIFLLVRG